MLPVRLKDHYRDGFRGDRPSSAPSPPSKFLDPPLTWSVSGMAMANIIFLNFSRLYSEKNLISSSFWVVGQDL